MRAMRAIAISPYAADVIIIQMPLLMMRDIALC